MSIEQPPLTMPDDHREYLTRQLNAIKNVDHQQLTLLTTLPAKPSIGKLYYFKNTIGGTITTVGAYVYKGGGTWGFLG